MTVNKSANEFEGFQQFHAEDPREEPYGSFHIFWADQSTEFEMEDPTNPEFEEGWYWQAQFPGCLPDGDPVGPFDTSRAALEDADEWNSKLKGDNEV